MRKKYKGGDVYEIDGEYVLAYEGETVYDGERFVGKTKRIAPEYRSDKFYCDNEVLLLPDADMIICGCHRLPALRTFKALAKALGYEVSE